ncbi:hypothetical protein VE03_01423 [Pseudogymnoascus sp. 23342-1-I1]|nr:hypothetical protein VE03_01423 [Pseudogymnoascus sp. 23342-1-I1]
MAQDENEVGLSYHVIGFYKSVTTSSELKVASIQAVKIIQDFEREAATNDRVFILVNAVMKKGEILDQESQLFLDRVHRNFVRHGMNIPTLAERRLFEEGEKNISDLSIDFMTNLNGASGGLWLTTEQLHGLPIDIMKTLPVNGGLHLVSSKYPDYFPVMRHATSHDTRRKVFMANENKCNENVPIFRQIVLLRDQNARILGYPNHATLGLQEKMVKTPQAVDKFLVGLREKLMDKRDKELTALKLLKKKELEAHGSVSDNGLYPWDYQYYNRIMEEASFKVDQELISEYFSLENTLLGMFHIFQILMGLRFVEAVGTELDALSASGKGQDIIWHEDVRFFSVWNDEDEGGGFLGYIYLDLFPRQGKFGHAANFMIQPGFRSVDGTRRYPVTSLVCNFPKPTAQKPSLLKHSDVVTMFHELGHGIHDLVSKTIYSRFHGSRTVRDFVEAPSQILENWCWLPEQLKSLSRHYSTLSSDYHDLWKGSMVDDESGNLPPEKMPDELIRGLISTKNLNNAIFNMGQLHVAIFDMAVHEPVSHEFLERMDISEQYNTLRSDIVGMNGPATTSKNVTWGNGEATFGHLVEGYDAGYYGYLSSRVYSADLFRTIFKQDPMNGTAGRRYRYEFLEKGGSQDEMKTITDFLGREPNEEAFYNELGLLV